MSFGLATVNVNELALLPHQGEMECLGNQDALTSQTTNHCVNPCLKYPWNVIQRSQRT
jgi:hypothetical protein